MNALKSYAYKNDDETVGNRRVARVANAGQAVHFYD